jgi:hypothetical protein
VENTNNGAIADTTITVGWSYSCSSCNNNNTTASSFLIDTSTSSPTLNQYITTNITARDYSYNRAYSYQGTVRFTVERRDTIYSSWTTASSTDYSLSPTSTYLWYNQQGYVSLSSHIRFDRSGLYRLRAVDDNNSGIIWYKEFDVSSSSTYSSYNRFDLSTTTNTPWRENFVNLTITAKDTNWYTLSSYNNRIRFQIFRRTYTSDSWTDITSSSLDNSTYRIYDTTYNFPSYNNGVTTISNFIKFYSDSYDYKVKVIDDYNSNVYGEIIYYLRNTGLATYNNNNYNNSTYSSSAYRFVWTLEPSSPELSSYFDVRLYAKSFANTTVTNYNRTVDISIERKLLAGSTTRSKTTSTYCRLWKTSYTFSMSDYGYATIHDIARCSTKWFYRLKFTDTTTNSVYGYLYFTVLDTDDFSSYVSGFSSSQRQVIQSSYETFMNKVNNREMNNPRLSYNTSRNTLWKNYYNELNAITYNKAGRLKNYSDLIDEANSFNDELSNLIR